MSANGTTTTTGAGARQTSFERSPYRTSSYTQQNAALNTPSSMQSMSSSISGSLNPAQMTGGMDKITPTNAAGA
jgi:hypothetical protein